MFIGGVRKIEMGPRILPTPPLTLHLQSGENVQLGNVCLGKLGYSCLSYLASIKDKIVPVSLGVCLDSLKITAM